MTKSKVSFADHLEEWYEMYRAPKVRDVTRQSYRIAINHVRNDPVGEKEFKKIKRIDMQGFFNRFGSTRRRNTVLDLKGLLNGCFTDAFHDGLIKINPVERVEVVSVEDTWTTQKLKEKREEKKWLEFDEYKKLKMYVISLLNISFQKDKTEWLPIKRKGEIYHTFKPHHYPVQMALMTIYVAMKTGARFSEILGITKNDYDFDKNILNIDKTWDYKYKKTFERTKNIPSIREIPLDKEFTIVLKNYLYWIEKFNVDINQGAIMVRDKQQVHNSVANNALTIIFELLEIERITLHKLRHTHASILIASGVSLQVVAKRLGHADTSMIQTTYGHLLESVEHVENEKILGVI